MEAKNRQSEHPEARSLVDLVNFLESEKGFNGESFALSEAITIRTGITREVVWLEVDFQDESYEMTDCWYTRRDGGDNLIYHPGPFRQRIRTGRTEPMVKLEEIDRLIERQFGCWKKPAVNCRLVPSNIAGAIHAMFTLVEVRGK